MYFKLLGNWAFLLLIGVVAVTSDDVCAATAAQQQSNETAESSVSEQLKAIQADLYSRDPHLKDDIKALNRILAIEPNSAEVHLLLGIAYHGLTTSEGVDMMAEAKAEYRQALAINPELLLASNLLAQLYLELGRPQNARNELRKALKHAPGEPKLLTVLSEAERQSGDPDAALTASQEATPGKSTERPGPLLHGTSSAGSQAP